MTSNINLNNLKKIYINFLFAFIPISFIAGNLLININILLIIISSLLLFGIGIFRLNFDLTDKLVFCFFAYATIVSFSNNLYSYYNEDNTNFEIITKTILYLRFLFLYFIVRYLIKENVLNLKFFFIISSICTLFVCFDLIYQLIFGKDIFGFPKTLRKLSGPFGDELIAGSYLQRFSLFLFFSLPFFLKIEKPIIFKIIFILAVILVVFSIIISGNRMPLILFLFSMILIVSLEKKARKYLLPFLLISSVLFLFAYNFNNQVKLNFGNFYSKTIWISKAIILGEADYNDPDFSGHYKEFRAGYWTWYQNKTFGSGVKSFKSACPKIVRNCSSHPHNYYLEMLGALGVIGTLIFLTIFLRVIFYTLKEKYQQKNLQKNIYISPFLFILIVELFPLKTSGSFFTSTNATFIFLVLSLTVALSKQKKLN